MIQTKPNEQISMLPPHDRDAERAVLGGILRDPDVMSDVLAVVQADSFYFDAHRKILAAVVDLANRSVPVDLVGLYDELRKRKELEDIGGKEYLADLWEAVPTGALAVYHARLVRNTSLFRGLIRAANEVLRDAHSPTMPAEDLLAQAERKIYELSMDVVRGSEPRRIGTVAREAIEQMETRLACGRDLAGLSTGYPDLDNATGGLRPGELVVIGARPSLGKTALSLSIAEKVASTDEGVLFFSLEMPAHDIATRLLSMQSSVPMHRISRPRELRRDDLDAVFSAANNSVEKTPLYIDDTPDQTAARVSSISRQACRRLNVQLIVIDYLQLMRPDNPRENRTQQVGQLALHVKQMARSLSVPVILLSQLNRESEAANRKPRLSDLRESGDIEAHADRVILLHREQGLSPENPVWPIDLIVAKNRNGPVGDVRLCYRRPVLRFENHFVG